MKDLPDLNSAKLNSDNLPEFVFVESGANTYEIVEEVKKEDTKGDKK